MKNKSILRFALFPFVLLGLVPTIAQDLNRWEERRAIDGQEERRHYIFDDMDIPIKKRHHPFFHKENIKTLQPIIPDFQVNENAGPNGASQYSLSISTDGSENFVITWVDSRNGDDDIYAQRYSGDGTALGSNFTTPYDDFDMDVESTNAASKGVKIIGHHETSIGIANYERQVDDAFRYYIRHGIDIVKTGYVGHGQEGQN